MLRKPEDCPGGLEQETVGAAPGAGYDDGVDQVCKEGDVQTIHGDDKGGFGDVCAICDGRDHRWVVVWDQ